MAPVNGPMRETPVARALAPTSSSVGREGVGGLGGRSVWRLTDRVSFAFFCVHFLPQTLFFGVIMAVRGRRVIARHDGGKLPLVPPANLALTSGEKPHWAALVMSCGRHGYLVDLESVAQAARRRAALWVLRESVAELGSDLLVETPSGALKVNPLLDALRNAETAYEASLKLLLLTPRSRQSLRRGLDHETEQVVDATPAQAKLLKYLL